MGNLPSLLVWDTQNETSQDVSDSSSLNTNNDSTFTSNIEATPSSNNNIMIDIVNDTTEPVSVVIKDSSVAPITNLTTSHQHTRNSQWITLGDIPISEQLTSDPICINGRDFIIVSIEDDDNFTHQQAFIHLYLYNAILNKWKKLEKYSNNKPVTIRARGTKCVYSGDILDEVYADSTIEAVSYSQRRRRRQLYVLTWNHIIRFILPPNLQSNAAKIRYSIDFSHQLRNPRSFILKNSLHVISSAFEYYGISDSTTIHLKNGTSEMHRFCAPIGSKALVYCELIKCVLMFCCDSSIYSYSQVHDKWSKLSICCPYDFSKSSFAVSNDKRYILIVRRYRYYFDNIIYIFDIESLQFKSSIIKCPVGLGVNSAIVSIGVTLLPDTVQIVSGVVRKWCRRYRIKIPDVIVQCICKYCSFNFLHLMANGNSRNRARFLHWKMSISDVITKQTVICSKASV